MQVKHFENGTIGKLLFPLGLSAVLFFGCNTGGEQSQAARPPSLPPPAVAPAVSVNDLMVAWIDHSAHELWDVEMEGHAPKNDAGWREVERHATQLAAAGPLLALGGAGQADAGWAQSPAWGKHTQALTNAGMAAHSAARAKNLEALIKANGELVEVCENCHKEFKPALPTEGKVHQPH